MDSTAILRALERRHTKDYFVCEVKNGPTWGANRLRIMDAMAFKRSWARPCIYGYEVKVSRSDFLSDEKWPDYLEMCNRFYFACPARLIDPAELDGRCGLVYVNEAGKCYTKRKALFRDIEITSDVLYYVILSKIESDRYPFHKSAVSYWQDWLAHKRSAEELAWRVRSALLERLAKSEEEIRGLRRELGEVRRILGEYKIESLWDLRDRLKSGVDRVPISVVDQVEEIQESLSKLSERLIALEPGSQNRSSFGGGPEVH